MSSITSPKLKLQKPYLCKHNVVYEFKCDCGNNYIGETKRPFESRIKEHGRSNRDPKYNTIIYKHIEECNTFINKQNVEIPPRQTKQDKLSYLIDHFKIIGSNYRYERARLVAEAIFIKFKQPTLNIQIDFVRSNSKKPATLKLVT